MMNKASSSKIFLHLASITALIFILWGKTLNQGLWGDGYYFFNPLLRGTGIITKTWPYNLMARDIWDIVIPIFRDNQMLYQLMQLIIFSILVFILYFLIKKLANTKIAIIASVLFLSNYGGIYEMLAEGNLNRFLDRIPNMLISLIGIYFLAVYFKKKAVKYLVLSFILFAAGVFFGHFASFLLPFVGVFSIIYSFNKKKILQSLLKGLLIAVIFTGTTFFIINHSDQKSGNNLSYYLNPEGRFIEKTLYFTTPLFVPKELVLFISEHQPKGYIPNPYIPIVAPLTFAVIFIASVIGVIIYKKDKNLFKLYLSSILSIPPANFLMIYTDPVKYNPFKYYQAGRDVFIQSIFYTIALSIALYIILTNFKKIYIPALAIFLAVFVTYNTSHSWSDIKDNQYLYEGTRQYLTHIKSIYPKFNSATTVVVGPRLGGPSGFIDDFYKPPSVNIISAPEDIARIKDPKRTNTYVMDVDYNPTPDGYYLPENVKIIDLTKCYRSFKFNLNEWGTKKISYYEALCSIK